MAVQESITILHLSDPQFGKNHRFGNLGLTEADAQFDTLFQRPSDDLAFLEKDKVKPQLVVVSGDLAEWGLKKEFEDVLTLLVKLTERLNLPRRHVVIVPGNHDVNRELCQSYFLECRGEGGEPVAPYWRKWKPYHELFQKFYGEEKDVTFSTEEPWTLWKLEELNLVVVGLN